MRKSMNSLKKRESIAGWGFILPALILFIVFTFIPIISIFYYSLTEWTGIAPPVFIGFDNFIDIFHNKTFYVTISNNIKFLILGVPLWTFFPLVIAVLLFEEVRGWKVFRAVYFFPSILSIAVIGNVFKFLFTGSGPFNTILRFFHLDFLALDWWANGSTAIPLIVQIINWVGFGVPMLIYLAGLANIDQSILEAARLDGANWGQRLRYIFFPSLKRLIQLNLVLNILYCFTSLFGYIFTMTSGGPGYETTVIEYLIYLMAFKSQKMGYASALCVVLAIFLAFISGAQFLLFERKEKKHV